jgi:hypothetical protein
MDEPACKTVHENSSGEKEAPSSAREGFALQPFYDLSQFI